jgi:hypothetical protein
VAQAVEDAAPADLEGVSALRAGEAALDNPNPGLAVLLLEVTVTRVRISDPSGIFIVEHTRSSQWDSTTSRAPPQHA